MSRFESFMGRERATAHAGSGLSSEALIAQEGHNARRLSIRDMEDQLWRLERVLTALGSLLQDSGVTATRLEARTLDLAREWYGEEPPQ